MRYLSALTICLFAFVATASAQNDAISKYFSKYVEDDRFTTVYISPKMFDLVQTMDIDLKDAEATAIKDVVNNMESIRILTSKKDTKKLYQEATKTLVNKEYETLMTVKGKNNANVQFLVKDGNAQGVIRELLLLVDNTGESNFVFMSFIGDINLKNIGKLSKAFEK